MKENGRLLEAKDYERLTDTIPYLLAGLTGHTDGHHIDSITVQQAGLSGFRILIRANGTDSEGDRLHFVGFSNASDPGAAILVAERGYRENLIRWKIDRFAKSAVEGGASKDERTKLSIRD